MIVPEAVFNEYHPTPKHDDRARNRRGNHHVPDPKPNNSSATQAKAKHVHTCFLTEADRWVALALALALAFRNDAIL